MQYGKRQVFLHQAQVVAHVKAALMRNGGKGCVQESGQAHGDQRQSRRQQGRRARQKPPQCQQDKRGRGQQRAAQRVQHLDPSQRAQRAFPAKPGQQLPVAATPAMDAPRGEVLSVGEGLDQFHVRDEPGPGEDAFKQVMAEKGVFGHAPGHRRLEDIDVVDTLAGKGALAEEILIDVRCSSSIGIHPARTRGRALKCRALPIRGQGGGDPRL